MIQIDLLNRFCLGQDTLLSLKQCPAEWQPLLKNLPTEQIPAVALALLSQHQALTEIHLPQYALTPVPIIPPLDLPPVPRPFWSLLKKVFKSNYLHDRQGGSGDAPCLRFLERRGYALPMKFWLPSSTDQPSLYKPWLDYVNPPFSTDDSLKPWRRVQPFLQRWRDTDPAAFRDWVSTRFHQESATDRLHLLMLFNRAVLPEDEPFLTQVASKDRVKKIKTLAKKFLLRLQPVNESIKEQQIALVHQYFIHKPSFRYSKIIHHSWQKNKDMLNDMHYLLAWISADTFAEAFDLSKYDMFSQVEFDDDTAIEIIVKNWLSDYDIPTLQAIFMSKYNNYCYSRASKELLLKIWRLFPHDVQHDYIFNYRSKGIGLFFVQYCIRWSMPLLESEINLETLTQTQLWQYWLPYRDDATDNTHAFLGHALGLWLPPSLVQVVASAIRISDEYYQDYDICALFELHKGLQDYQKQI